MASDRRRPEHGPALAALYRGKAVRKCFGVYLGKHALRDRPMTVLPLHEFLRALAARRVLRPARQA